MLGMHGGPASQARGRPRDAAAMAAALSPFNGTWSRCLFNNMIDYILNI